MIRQRTDPRFFPPMVDDPYTLEKLRRQMLSDIYAMAGEVKTALNIVCFRRVWIWNILGEIMRVWEVAPKSH